MAHSDYDCCAVCDSKMTYRHAAAGTKDSICSTCTNNLFQWTGVYIGSVDDLLTYFADLSDDKLLETLHSLDFCSCMFENKVDRYLKDRGMFIDDPTSHRHRLKELSVTKTTTPDCKGDILVGSGCGACSRCKEAIQRLLNENNKLKDKLDFKETMTSSELIATLNASSSKPTFLRVKDQRYKLMSVHQVGTDCYELLGE